MELLTHIVKSHKVQSTSIILRHGSCYDTNGGIRQFDDPVDVEHKDIYLCTYIYVYIYMYVWYDQLI